MQEQKQDTTAKLLGVAVALGSAWLAQRAVDLAWKGLTGKHLPKAEDEGDHRFSEVALAATVTGAVVALMRVLATRGAAKIIK